MSSPVGPVLRCDQARFGYGGRAITAALDLVIDHGHVVALLGANGSGKSTLVKGVLGLSDLIDGSVEILGVPLAKFTTHHRLGYVPQRHTLSSSVRSTTREVVATGLLSSRPWWRRAGRVDAERISAALEVVGLSDRADTDVATLSGGQQRRVLIARALVGGPDVLIMDEPTAGVDAAHQDALAVVLRRLASTGVTMIVVTHELAALRGIVDRIVEMDTGRISFDGTPTAYADHRAALARAADSGSNVQAIDHDAIDHDPGHGGHHHDDEVVDDPAARLLLGSGPLDAGRGGAGGQH